MTEIILKDGNFVRRTISESFLGSQETVISQLAEQASIMLPKFMPFGSGHIHLLTNKRQMVMITELTELPFSTYFQIDSSRLNRLIPVFSNQRGSVKIDQKWPVNADAIGRCFFAFLFDLNEGAAFPNKPYLFQYYKKELFSLPYPNIYEDGRICMGPDWERNKGRHKDVMSEFIAAHSSFHATVATEHLVSGYTYELFSVDLESKWIVPENPHRYLRPCSAAFMSGFSL